jgi:hypothetical protein
MLSRWRLPIILRGGVAAMRGIRIETIEAAAKDRPEGYLEDVMSYVVERKDNFVLFENDDYYMLRDKYSGDVDPMVRGSWNGTASAARQVRPAHEKGLCVQGTHGADEQVGLRRLRREHRHNRRMAC